MKYIAIFMMFFLLLIAGCKIKPEHAISAQEKIWGESEGKTIRLFTLTNKNGMEVRITNLGATVTYIAVPDKNGKIENIALGFDSLDNYLGNHPYFGSLVGRYANRIARGRFVLNGKEYTLAVNNGVNHLHGGIKGFSKQVFEVTGSSAVSDSAAMSMSYLSKDMEEGYPGNLTVHVTYVLTNNNELKIRYEAETDKSTVLNLTNHSYFNLSGCRENVLNHELVLFADSITPTDSTLIPTGKKAPVAGTPYDFTTPHKIGERIGKVPGGYDINYILRKNKGELSLAAEVYEPESGRLIQAYTTEPGIQFYSGNFLDGSMVGYNGTRYNKHYGLCLEAQHYPDSPNQPNFPAVVLDPGEKYTQLTVYKFSTR
jgi:aldose 1-epimerase